MKHKIFSLFTAALLLSSCNKDKPETTTIYGQLLTKGINTPHAGVHVWLTEENASGGALGGGSSTSFNGMRVETYSDADGRYTLKYDMYQTPKYYLNVANIEGHWGPIAKKQIKPGGSVEANVNYIPYAYLKLHIKNINPYNGYDKINIVMQPGGTRGYQGSGIDHTENIKTGGNINVPLYYSVRKNDILTSFRDTLEIPMGDTMFYEIFY